MEVEYIHTAEAVPDALWLRSLLAELLYKGTKATVIHIS
jgi:hypothetical protein